MKVFYAIHFDGRFFCIVATAADAVRVLANLIELGPVEVKPSFMTREEVKAVTGGGGDYIWQNARGTGEKWEDNSGAN